MAAKEDRASVEAEAQTWLRDDAELRNRDVWKPVLHEKSSKDNPELGAVVSAYQASGDPCKWFKIEGRVRTTIDEIRDLLDFRLLERQSEWHHLFVEGEIVEKHARPGEPASDVLELCWMAYESGSFLVSVRDFIYWKVGKTTEENNGGFQLSYRTVPQSGLNVTIPERRSYVRGEFQAAHFIEDIGDGNACLHVHPKGGSKGNDPLVLDCRSASRDPSEGDCWCETRDPQLINQDYRNEAKESESNPVHSLYKEMAALII